MTLQSVGVTWTGSFQDPVQPSHCMALQSATITEEGGILFGFFYCTRKSYVAGIMGHIMRGLGLNHHQIQSLLADNGISHRLQYHSKVEVVKPKSLAASFLCNDT